MVSIKTGPALLSVIASVHVSFTAPELLQNKQVTKNLCEVAAQVKLVARFHSQVSAPCVRLCSVSETRVYLVQFTLQYHRSSSRKTRTFFSAEVEMRLGVWLWVNFEILLSVTIVMFKSLLITPLSWHQMSLWLPSVSPLYVMKLLSNYR